MSLMFRPLNVLFPITVSSRLFDAKNLPLKMAPQVARPEGLPPPSLLLATLMLIILHNQA